MMGTDTAILWPTGEDAAQNSVFVIQLEKVRFYKSIFVVVRFQSPSSFFHFIHTCVRTKKKTQPLVSF